jgi:deoxyribodipyrimidine photo-lyase
MVAFEAVVESADPRVEILRGGEFDRDGRCVLWWMSRAQRASAKTAANVAIDLGNALGMPVVAVFCVDPNYPRATERSWTFLLEGLAEMPDALAGRGVGWQIVVGDPVDAIPEAAARLGAVSVVADLDPLQPGRRWREEVAARLAVPMAVVDADTVVPAALFPKEEWAPRTIRPKIHRHLEAALAPLPEPSARIRSDVRDRRYPMSLLADLPLDRSAGPSPRFRGGSAEAQRRLDRFVSSRLDRYGTDRNRADLDGTSTLSPYLHFGQIGPLQVALAAADSGAGQESIAAFLDELIVQRELAINFALRNPAHATFDGLPDWGRKTLEEHRNDEREILYGPETLERGETHDPLWNAAQRQMAREGWMPNRLRMYWAKRLLAWTATPEEAFAIAVTLNDRYFFDGRDANGYAGIAWSIGGRHDRPFPPNRPVMGLIRPMSARGMRRHVDIDAYIARVERESE